MLIKNAKLLQNNKEVIRNILIEDGKIKKITNENLEDKNTIDANNNFVIPGIIDIHVHCREPGATHKEDFYTASRAAAKGGITTIYDMPNTNPATTTNQLLKEKQELAKKAIVNIGFHLGATSDNLEEIKSTKAKAVKVYRGSSTGNLLVDNKEIFEQICKTDKIIIVHAEHEADIKSNQEKIKPKTAKDHPKVRNNEVAKKEVEITLSIAKKYNTKLHIAHMSTKEELELIKQAKQDNQSITCEVSPHHLFISKDEIKDNFLKMNPPLRSKEDIKALWENIDYIDMIATDHAPHLIEEKLKGYNEAPAGVPGLETSLPLMLNAINQNKITLTQVVRMMSTNPAKLFNLNKGKIEVGYDADLTIIDLNLEKKVKDLETKCSWSPWQDKTLKGWPITTIINGNIVWNNGKIADIKGKLI